MTRRAAALLISLLASLPVLAVNQLDQPSLGGATPVIYLSNRTAQKVVFYLESKGTNRTEQTLDANESASFTGAPGDTWFNVEVYTNVGGNKAARKYGVDVGERNYFDWKDGVLDLFKLPPSGR